MKTFPIMLCLQGRKTVVVGGGPVGLRKVRALLACGASVTLVAEGLSPQGNLTGVTVIDAPYAAGHLEGAMLVFACTSDRRLNERIARDGRNLGAIVNVADQPADCDFHLPATVSDGDVIVAVGTGGAAPALAAALKDNLAGALPQRVGEFAALLGQLREELKGKLADSRRRCDVMRELSGVESYNVFLAEGAEAVRRKLFSLAEKA